MKYKYAYFEADSAFVIQVQKCPPSSDKEDRCYYILKACEPFKDLNSLVGTNHQLIATNSQFGDEISKGPGNWAPFLESCEVGCVTNIKLYRTKRELICDHFLELL